MPLPAPSADQDDPADRWATAGFAAIARRDHRAARQAVLTALALSPVHHNALSLLADLSGGDRRTAARWLGRLMVLPTGDREVLVGYGLTLMALGDGAGAGAAIARAYQLPWPPPRGGQGDGRLKLHLGGVVRRDGWIVVNALDGPHVDVVGDVADLGQFDDGAAEIVYASHVYEHFSYIDALPRALAEACRVLTPGGKLFIAVPDFGRLSALWHDPAIALSTRFRVMRAIFGGGISAYDHHYVGLDRDFLCGLLIAVGFREIEQVEAFGLFEDTSDTRINGIPISLNLVATK